MKTTRRSFFKQLALTALAGKLLIEEAFSVNVNDAYEDAQYEVTFLFDSASYAILNKGPWPKGMGDVNKRFYFDTKECCYKEVK